MILMIAGASHTGKTAFAQRLLEKYKYPYLSIDHLKMGLIRSGNTDLTPESEDKALTDYLWDIVKEIIKTAVENGQNLIVEGCYIPFDWKKSFDGDYLPHIKYRCLVMSRAYIENHYEDIMKYESTIERRPDDPWCTVENLIHDNEKALRMCRLHGADHILIDETYPLDMDF